MKPTTSKGTWVRRATDESGVALISVIGLTAVLTLLSVAAVGFVLNAQRVSRDHQDWNAALAAAEAGVDDYLARLNRDPGYYTTADPSLNPALDSWAPLPDSDAFYTYSVDASDITATGGLTLSSTGRVTDEQRTIEVMIRPDSFFDFIYFTDYEVVDPAIIGPSEPEHCARRFNASPSRPSGCIGLRFVNADVLDGPVHSNDAIQLEGTPRFRGPTTTSFNNPVGGYVTYNSSSPHSGPAVTPVAGDPKFARDFDPAWEVEKTFPPTNDAILADAENFGCIYYGPTYIHFDGDTMTVKSPLSGNRPAGKPATDPSCGSAADLVGHTSGIAIPPVIYVDQAGTCGSFSNSNHPLGIDRDEETRDDLRPTCRSGDVFVWGNLDTQTTLASQNNINIIWDLTYQSGIWEEGTNILGLIADNFVQVRQAMDGGNNASVTHDPPFPSDQPSGTPFTGTGSRFRNPEIHAAILSLRRSFRVQNHGVTEDGGVLSVRGAIAQRFRGPVGTGTATNVSTGFLKDYVYDERLRGISPPYFIQPVDAQFGVQRWAEVQRPTGLPAY